MMLRGNRLSSDSPRVTAACAAVALICLLCPALLAQEWEIQVLDNGKQFSIGDRCLRLDAQGRPHIAYGGDWQYYAWYDGTEWQYEVVDSSGGSYARLALDSSNYPHIGYRCSTHLTYAYKDGTGWHLEVVDAVGDQGQAIGLESDSSGYPHILYSIYSTGAPASELRYAYKDAAGWHLQDPAIGGGGSFVLDSSGYPHTSYYDDANRDLKYAYEDAAGWQEETVDSQGNVGWFDSIALDSSGHPHISYASWMTVSQGCLHWDVANDLKYAFKDDTGWHVETVDVEGYTGWYTSVALDSSGSPHISYFDDDLRYAHLDASGWQLETAQEGYRSYTSIALDASDQPHIGYQSGAFYENDLSYTFKDVSGWHPQIVDSERDGVGEYASLALDGADHAHVAYGASGMLRYATQGADFTLGQIVDAQGVTGEISLALDPSGSPHISYCEDASYALRHAYEDAAGWHTEAVDSSGSSFENSLAVDALGYAHIAYGGLRYAYQDASGWYVETVGGEAFSGRSLALDGSNYPHVSFLGFPDYALEYAFKDEGGWHFETVDAEGYSGWCTSLALDGTGYPHISYVSGGWAVGNLEYAFKDAGGWHLETIDPTGEVESSTSLALDTSGRPHIAYYDGDDADLKYAYKDATGWHIQTVDAEGYVGEYCSLRLDSAERVHICYQGGGSALKYARMVIPPAVATPTLPLCITSFDVWPNPARGVVHARLAGPEGQGTVRLTVVDLLGRRVMSLQQPGMTGTEATMTLRLPETIPTGQYFLGVEGNGSRQFVPITVVK